MGKYWIPERSAPPQAGGQANVLDAEDVPDRRASVKPRTSRTKTRIRANRRRGGVQEFVSGSDFGNLNTVVEVDVRGVIESGWVGLGIRWPPNQNHNRRSSPGGVFSMGRVTLPQIARWDAMPAMRCAGRERVSREHAGSAADATAVSP